MGATMLNRFELRVDRRSDEEDPAIIIFTSGTGGRPKAAVLPHRSLLANLQMLLNLTRRLPHQVDENSGEVALHTGPLFHIGGGQMLLRSIVVGNTIVMPAGRFDPGETIALIERHKVTRWAAVPTMVSRVLDHPDIQTAGPHQPAVGHHRRCADPRRTAGSASVVCCPP